jgi:radical SAM protein with 4Fe4S-binding SPASM domain
VGICKEYNEENTVVISPRFHIRPDREYCIIYPFDPVQAGSWRIISDVEGTALTLLDGKRTLKEVTTLIAELYDIELEKGEEIIKSIIEHSNEKPGEEFLEVLSSEGDNEKFTRYNTIKFIERLKSDTSNELKNGSRSEVPLNLLFMPTNKCDVDCIYCYSEKKHILRSEYLTIERWCEIIDEACELGIDIIVFSGGDPLTYHGILPILERLARNEMKFLLPTKSFISEELARRFSEIGLHDVATIQVSIDGVSSNIDKLVRRRDYCKRAFKSIENLTGYSFPVQTNTVCTPLNIYEVPELMLKLHSMGVKSAHVTNYGRTYYRHDDSLFITSEQIEWINNQIDQIKSDLQWEGLHCNAGARDYSIMEKEDKARNWPSRAHCSGGTSSMTITPNGNVVLCEQAPQSPPFIVGNLKEQNILDVWNSPELEAFIHPSQLLFEGTACAGCPEFDDCHRVYGRCFRDALFTYNSLYAPSPNCPLAPPGLKMA